MPNLASWGPAAGGQPAAGAPGHAAALPSQVNKSSLRVSVPQVILARKMSCSCCRAKPLREAEGAADPSKQPGAGHSPHAPSTRTTCPKKAALRRKLDSRRKQLDSCRKRSGEGLAQQVAAGKHNVAFVQAHDSRAASALPHASQLLVAAVLSCQHGQSGIPHQG